MGQVSRTRTEQVKNLERWADRVKPEDLRDADPAVSQEIIEVLDDCAEADKAITAASLAARPQRRDSA